MTRLGADVVRSFMADITPSRVPRAFFVGAASTILLVHAIPALRARFLAYGPRAITSQLNVNEKPLGQASDFRRGKLDRLLDYFASLQVPHAYFLHFYVVSVASSMFWAYQLLMPDSWIKAWIQNTYTKRGHSMSAEQILLTWSMMTSQGFRRLAESVLFAKPTASRMSFMHWLLGIAFYLVMGVAVWSEGVGQLPKSLLPFIILKNFQEIRSQYTTSSPYIYYIADCLDYKDLSSLILHHLSDVILSGDLNPSNLHISAPSIRTMLCVPVFLIASGVQHDCHTYLAALPKYSLPSHPAFHNLICPHYTAECVIYLSMAVIAASSGFGVNGTIFTALVFVSVNLGITASITKEWYAKKFGAEKVHKRWNLLPYVF